MHKRASQIQIKRVYDPPGKFDGTRVLVDRLWPRGWGKEKAALTLWLKEVAPSPELRTWFGHDPARWTEFGRRYRAELKNDEAVGRLGDFLTHGRVTLRHSSRNRSLKDSTNALSVGLPRLLKSIFTLLVYAQKSMRPPANSDPLSHAIRCGTPRSYFK